MLYGFLIALISPAFDALGNIVDGKISRTMNLNSIVFYGALFNLIFVPLIFVFWLPKIPPVSALPVILFIGAVEILYMYPYTLSLRNIDTSIVTALFSLGKFFVPLFAFLIVGEKLSPYAYAGFFLILVSSMALSFHRHEWKFRLNSSFFSMLGCSVLLSLSAVAEKYMLGWAMDWLTLFFWTQICASGIVITLLSITRFRKDVMFGFQNLKPDVSNLLLQSFLAIWGVMSLMFAIAIAPVTFVKWISSLQPFMVIFASYLIHKISPRFVFESFWGWDVLKKALCFLLTALWVWMMTYQGNL